jgi:type II secretory pathway pseudopilin PulG
MVAPFGQTDKRKADTAWTLMEVVMSMAVLALAMAGMIYGYVQTNYRAEWSSMSLAAQSSAVEAIEQARAAPFDVHVTQDDPLQPTTYSRTNTLLIPSTGQSVVITNQVWISNVITNLNIPLRQYLATCWWRCPPTTNGTWFSNTVVTWRAPDE